MAQPNPEVEKQMSELWSRRFYEQRQHIAWRAPVVGGVIKETFEPRSYLDVGCSIGEFVQWFGQQGVIAYGAEAPWFPQDLYLGEKDKLLTVDLTDPGPCIWPKVDLLTCFMTIGRLDEKYWPKIAQLFTRTSDTVVTVVEKGDDWRFYMEYYRFTFMGELTEHIKKQLQPWEDKTAIRSFCSSLQVFRRLQ